MIPKRFLVPFLATLAIMWIVPVPIYGAFSAIGAVDLGGGQGARFLVGVTVIKIGFALGFVALYQLGRWRKDAVWTYAALWWLMFAILEAGQVVMPGGNSVGFAVAGVLSEAIYFPVAARVLARRVRG